MENVRQAAFLCVGRAVFFASLAISLVMLSFAFDIVRALQAGAILSMGLAAILLWFFQTAGRRRPEKSETWLVLAAEHRPANEHARRFFQQVMAETYLYFCVRAFGVGSALCALALAAMLTGFEARMEN
jgi:hypothetical protein